MNLKKKLKKTISVIINALDFGSSLFYQFGTVYLIIMNTTFLLALLAYTFQGVTDLMNMISFVNAVMKVYIVSFILRLVFRVVRQREVITLIEKEEVKEAEIWQDNKEE